MKFLIWKKNQMKNKKNINYKSYFNFYENVLIPSKSLIPEWYKGAKNDFLSKGKTDPISMLEPNSKNFKMCMPLFDSLSVGYLVLCPADLVVTVDEFGSPRINWVDPNYDIVNYREKVEDTVPVPAGCNPRNFTWVFPVSIKLPKGYSAILTHPFNRNELPFVTTTGIIDGSFAFGFGQYPFFIKQGFSGVIKQGTPIAQVIPFKSDSWKMREDSKVKEEAEKNLVKSRSVLFGWYKNNYWKKKEYE
jgi:hypothetical protein